MRDDFARLYRTAIAQRARFAAPPSPVRAMFAEHAATPPVIFFGRPRESVEVPLLVTVGLNPSPREFTGQLPPLPKIDDVDAQYQRQSTYFQTTDAHAPYADWFELASAFLQGMGSSHQQQGHFSPYADGDAIHVDLSPLVTDPIDHAYGVAQDRNERDVVEGVRDVIRAGIHDILVPLLDALAKRRPVSAVLFLGFVPEARAIRSLGNSVMRDTLAKTFVSTKRKKLLEVEKTPVIAWGHASSTGAFAPLGTTPCGFVSQGPSYRKYWQRPANTMSTAGRELASLRA